MRLRLSPSVGTAMLARRPRLKLSITLLVALALALPGKLALYRLALLLLVGVAAVWWG